MSAKTTFVFAVVAAIALGSAFAGPLTTIEGPGKENNKPSPTGGLENFDTPEVSSNTDADGTAVSSTQQQTQSGPTEDSATESVTTMVTNPDSSNTKAEKPEMVPVTTDAETVTGPNSGSVIGPVQSVGEPTVHHGPRPKPFFTGGVQTINMGPSIPFFMEFFQPFQPIHPFPGQQQQPNRQQHPNPYGSSVDPFGPMRIPSFDQLVNAYTNEFRNMLASMERDMSQMENVEPLPKKPLGKTTSRTEVIDGHVVHINETTYDDGDANHKVFYRYKEIQVVPEKSNKKVVSNEKIVSQVNDDSQTQNEDTNDIKSNEPAPVTSVVPEVVNGEDTKENLIKKVDG